MSRCSSTVERTHCRRPDAGSSPAGGSSELARIRAEQERCGEYLRSGGPDCAGARMGAADWVMEEVLCRDED